MRSLFLALCLFILPLGLHAQTAATLVADSVTLTADQRLIASGNVEILFDGTRLSAAAITYDQATDRLDITGPIFIRAADGTILTADRASLDPQLENGILIGARLVLAQQLQLAANQIDRIDGRYTQLTRVAATSCAVCAGRSPLWEIRAGRVVHDEAEQQLYFDNATFHIRGLPIFWLPRMRLPDPTLTRATGLLIPRYRSTDLLGFGVKLPYFIKMGDYRDLTLTPYFSAQTSTFEARYRQEFLRGSLEINLALSDDTLVPGETRGYLFAQGDLDLGAGFQLDYGAQMVSDDSYLLDYGTSDRDRLESYARITRVRADDLFLADITVYQSLRTGESTASLPPLVTEVSYERRTYPAGLGGTLTYGGAFDSYYRSSDVPGDQGRDVARIGAAVNWTRDWVLPMGIVAEARARATLAYSETWDDPGYDASALRLSQTAGVVLRWPFAAVGPNGGAHILEPLLAIGHVAAQGPAVANEDSQRVEFDEGNLLSFGRYPGSDVIESGSQVAAGVNWSRIGPSGTNSRLTFGRVWRADATTDMTASSGLDGTRSDWLIAGQLHFPSGLRIDGKTLLNDNLAPTKTAALIGWHLGKVDLDAAYVWLIADADEDRAIAVSEWTFDADYRINETWSVGLNGRYDVVVAEPARAGLRIGWQNECVSVELSASRRYASSTTVGSSTDYGLSIGLNGFSAGRSGAAPRRTCAN